MSSATVTGFRLSPQQRHLWPLQAANPSFNAWVAVMLTGPVDVGLLHSALSEIVARHEILRTTYRSLPGMKAPVQVIADSAPLTLRTTELDASRADEEQAIAEFIAREAGEAFDYEREPLVRAALTVVSPGRHLLVVTLCAMCADSRTLRNLFEEIASTYGSPGQAAAPRAERVQYLQFSEWQHELLEESDAEEGRDYWGKQKLGRLLDAPLRFAEEPAPARRFDPAVLRFGIGPDLTAALSALARRFQISLSDLLLACWQVLHWRLNDGEEVVVGRVFDGRRYEELGEALGIFSKTLPLRVGLQSEKRFSEIIRASADQGREAEQWQDYFAWQRDGGPPPSEAQTASVKLAFEYFEAPPDATARGALCSFYRFYSCPDPFLLKLVCVGENGAVRFELHRDRGAIGRDTAERIAGHFGALLKSVADDPFERVGSLGILDDAQREEIFNALKGRVEPTPRARIHELFEQQAERWPERVAVACEGDALTYKQLDERANQLAHRLRRLGVRAERAVGICLPPSTDMLVAILGVLKSGGFYVPLDPAYPRDRLSFILNDTRAAVLISERSIADGIAGGQLTTIFMDEERGALAEEPAARPDAEVGAAHLAYVIYTSGSTGRPKGVLVSHENLVHSTFAREVYYQESLTTYLLLSSFSFDSSVAGLFWTLCTGATLLLPAEEARREMPALTRLIRRHQVSHLLCLPSLYSLLLEAADPEDLRSVRCVIVAGEACPRDLPEKHSRASRAALYNEYGPTEGTVWASVYKTGRGATRQIPIGGPIANTQIYILDGRLQPVPFGVSGELFIGGGGITRGYLNLPGMTAEKFVPDQFGGVGGARLYRTGDRVSCRPNGEIDFLGRFDQQVKLRGYRIELGEIESVLGQHPGVGEAVCLVEQVEDRLLAFAVPRPRHAPVIRGRQRHRLPNNAAVVEHGRNEADFLYRELFEQQIYFKHGVSLRDGDCVFDVGAHIGLFTMMVNRMRDNLRVYAFEPAQPLFELLQINAELYCGRARLFRCGLSNRAGTAPLTFYPHFPMMSGYYADPQAEAGIMKSFIRLQRTAESPEADADEQYYAELLSTRFQSEQYDSELRTLHAVIEEEGVGEIDLLKIDVEKSELDVLAGIAEDDWRKIRQVVAHVHDIASRLAAVVSLLERHGFRVVAEEDQSVKGQGIYYVYARRAIPGEGDLTETSPTRLAPFEDAVLRKEDLAAYARERLPGFMVPSSFTLLEALPLLPNGKLNRRALLESVEAAREQDRLFVAPSTPLEELLAGIWSDVLKTDRVGIHDNFFDLGGHSFLAIKAHSRLSRALGREIPLLKLFEYPTLQGLANFLEEAGEKSAPAAQTQDWAEKRRQAIMGRRQPRRAGDGQANRN